MSYSNPLSRHSAFYVPNAPAYLVLDNGPTELHGFHLRWLNSRDRDNFALNLMPAGDRPGYKLVQGKTIDDTKALAVGLGLSEHHVDSATNRITHKEHALACIPEAEHQRRCAERKAHQLNRAKSMGDEYDEAINALPSDDIKPYRKEVAEHEDEKAFHNRPGKPVVAMPGIPVTPAT